MKWAAMLLLAAVVLGGCGGDVSVTGAGAAPIVDRLTAAPSPQRWDFSYQPDSASPYFDCLSGLDAVSGAIDRTTGVLRLTPVREAPSLIVTDSALMIGHDNGPDSWFELVLDPGGDELPLVELFGEILASYITTGIEAPDLKMTLVAAIDIAASVEVVPAPAGLDGDAIEITLDPDLYLAQLSAGGIVITDEDRGRIPAITGVIDPQGRVIGLVVDPRAGDDGAPDDEHRDRYVISATYDDLETLSAPPGPSRTVVAVGAVEYPEPEESCSFGS